MFGGGVVVACDANGVYILFVVRFISKISDFANGISNRTCLHLQQIEFTSYVSFHLRELFYIIHSDLTVDLVKFI